MFAINIKRAYTLCDRIFIRTLRNNRLPRDNPGLNQRAAVFKEEGITLEPDAEEFLDESEGNFLDLGKTYKEHAKDRIMEQDNLRHLIVKRKYFKENMPNLLTWSEKEQIRLLSSEHPDEWTPEKLAESFPITPEVVKKLTKYPWKPATAERIKRHDYSAMRNWKELKEGTLDIPADLRKHLLKFSDRTIPPLDAKSIKVDITPEDMGEYQSIIDKCSKSKTNNEQNNNSFHEHNNDNQDKSKNTKTPHKLTLDELKDKIKKEMEDGNEVNVSDQIILQNKNEISEIEVKSVEMSNLEDDQKGKFVTVFKNNPETDIMEIKTYPNRIRIPKKAWTRGGTYKIDDCYYDDDGKFLYRVIGMNN